MTLAKPAGAILIAAILAACAQTRTTMPDEPSISAEARPIPHEEPGAVPEDSATAVAQPAAGEQDGITDRRDIAAAQRILNQLGYNAGKADGIAGPNTRQAVRAFQKDRGLTKNGQLTVALADKLKAESSIVVRPGDLLVYSDGETELVEAKRKAQWNEGGGRRIVAVRPSMAGWPPEARTGLDWAVSHALDDPAKTVKWSSTGVGQKFEIYASELTPGEAELAGENSKPCRRYELHPEGWQSTYPSIACRDSYGLWYIVHSSIRLARPATELRSVSPSNVQ